MSSSSTLQQDTKARSESRHAPTQQPISKNDDGTPVVGRGTAGKCGCNEGQEVYSNGLCIGCLLRHKLGMDCGVEWAALTDTKKAAVRAKLRDHDYDHSKLKKAARAPMHAANANKREVAA